MNDTASNIRSDDTTGEPSVPVVQRPLDSLGRPQPLQNTRLPKPIRVPARTALNYGVDLALTVSFLALAWLMTIPHLAFPAGQEAYRFHLWGVGIDDWRQYQLVAFCVFAFLVLVHVTLHWNWICSITNTLIRNQPAGRDNGSRTLIGVGILIGLLHLLAATVLWAQFRLTPVDTSQPGRASAEIHTK